VIHLSCGTEFWMQIAGALFALAAAMLWLLSAVVRMPSTAIDQLAIEDLGTISESFGRQSRRSALAAVSAAIAAILSAVLVFSPTCDASPPDGAIVLIPVVLIIGSILSLVLYLDKKYPATPEDQGPVHHTSNDATASLARATWVIAGLTLAILGTGVFQYLTFNKQLGVMQDQLNEARDEQRPIVWAGKNLGTPELITNPKGTGQVVWDLHYTNDGKGFVASGTYQSFMRLGNGEFEQSYGQRGSNPMPPVAPTDDQFITVISPQRSPEELAVISRMERGFSIRVKFIYFELNGRRHETEICLTKLLSGAIQFCPGGSYVK
jgi:hypothetical protein